MEQDKRRRTYTSPDRSFVLVEWTLDPTEDTHDMRVVKSVNPAPWHTQATLRRRHDSPSMTDGQWLRMACGIWTEGDEPIIKPEQWDPLRADIGTIRDGEEVWLGIRTGQEGGSGIGIVAMRADGSAAVAVEQHPDEWPDLAAALRRLMDTYQIRSERIVIDERQFGIGADFLERSGFPLVNVYQSPVALMEATATFLGLVGSSKVIHDGDPELRRQVLAAQVKESTTGAYFRPVAQQNAFFGLIMAVHQAAEHAGDRSPKIHVYKGA